MRNDIKKIKDAITNKKDWLETNESKRNCLIKKAEKTKEEEYQNKIRKEMELKKIRQKNNNINKKKKELGKQIKRSRKRYEQK